MQSLKNKRFLAEKCEVAVRHFERMKGLMGRNHLDAGAGMYFPRCNNIHMWFMRMHLDVVFVKSRLRNDGSQLLCVSSLHQGVRPWKLLPLMDFSAHDTLELPPGTIERCQLNAGDELEVSDV
ncbi:MAG: DUF192 domain-containing protein [Planctomycetota bacterium]